MKKTFLWLLVGLIMISFTTTYLAGCSRSNGGGGGSAPGGVVTGQSTFSKGVITDTEKIIVNGVEFDTANANITVNGDSGDENDLKVGKFATVRGSSGGLSGTATDVDLSNLLMGPVRSAITGTLSDLSSTATLTVFGQSIIIDQDTKFEPASLNLSTLNTGSVIEVSGITDHLGNIHATFIESKPTGTGVEFNIRGVVSSSTGSTFVLKPSTNSSTPLNVTLGPDATLPADLSDGKFVNVKIDPQTFTNTASTDITAKSVTVETPLIPAENDRVFVEGFVTAATGTDAAANTFTIDGMTINAGSLALQPAGTHVVVSGTFSGGVLNAEHIRLVGPVQFIIGAITSAGTDTTGNISSEGTTTIVVNGETIDTSTAAISVNAAAATAADLRAGKQVIVETPLISNLSTTGTGTDGLDTGGTGTGGLATGASGTATNIWIIENLTGPVSGMTGSLPTGIVSTGTATITVFGQSIVVNSNTKFDQPLTSIGTGTVTSFNTGSAISVSGEQDGDGNIIATFIQTNPTTTQYHVLGLVTSVTGSPISSFRIRPAQDGPELTVNLSTAPSDTNGGSSTRRFVVGDFVDVKIDAASYPAPFTETTIDAVFVDIVDIPLLFENDRILVEGVAGNVSGNTFTVNSVEVDAGTQSMAGITNGRRVMVRGTVSADGTLTADQIQLR